MDRKQAETFMSTARNRELWISEVLGCDLNGHVYRSKYQDGYLYIQWDKRDSWVDVYDTANIYPEIDHEIDVKEFNSISKRSS